MQTFAFDMFPMTQVDRQRSYVRDRDSRSSSQRLFAIQSYDKNDIVCAKIQSSIYVLHILFIFDWLRLIKIEIIEALIIF